MVEAIASNVVSFSPRAPSQNARPEAFVKLPDDNRQLVKQALDIIDVCRSDAAIRTAYYRQLNLVIETGRQDGTKSLMNLLYNMIDRLASMLFSPVNIQFALDFENEYPDEILARGHVASRLLARSWERSNTDILFAQGVFEALKYGAAILKQWVTQEGPDKLPQYHSSLVMPWQFGVFRPDSASLDEQPAIVETVLLSLPEVWRRISHMPDARALFDRIRQAAAPNSGSDLSNSFFHSVLSTSQINTANTVSSRAIPGGIVQLSTDPAFMGIGPSTVAPLVKMHELWMWDGGDYTTIQIVEPDILVAPRYRRANVLFGAALQTGLHPYTLIQPVPAHGNFWGRSMLADVIEPQNLLSTTAQDMKRLYGLQVDKILAFAGGDGITDEQYDQMRAAGFLNLGPGASVNDLTPRFPPETLPLIDKLIQVIRMILGFDNMLSGQGEPGVRAGVMSNPLMRAAGAPLKDTSLIVERQCALAADLRLSMMEIKDGRTYWTNPKAPEQTSFLLSNLPEDRRVVVDGHTTSPIFADDHLNLLINGLKLGLVDKISAIEQMPFQNKDIILRRVQEAIATQQKMMDDLRKTDPEEWARLIEKQAGGKRH